jgi:hypothetical protein
MGLSKKELWKNVTSPKTKTINPNKAVLKQSLLIASSLAMPRNFTTKSLRSLCLNNFTVPKRAILNSLLARANIELKNAVSPLDLPML